VKSFMFGPAGEELYGVLHLPAGDARRTAVVLCHPLPFEYMRRRWQHRQAAELLAEQGFAVLRFDWSGTGDSAGDALPGSLAAAGRDVALAASELSERTDRPFVCAAAMGGAAAVLARASQDHGFAALLLVDPPLSGSDYLGALSARRAAEHQAAGETLGVRLPDTFRRELESLRLLDAPPRADRVLLLATAHEAGLRELERAAAARGSDVTLRERPSAADPRPSELEEALLSNALPSEMAAFVAAELPA
jgi:pimeloyl-ACP methyl ester carboxylesterase